MRRIHVRVLLALTALTAGACDPQEPTNQYDLTVAKGGIGAGTVTASGISCGDDCTESYAEGASITLVAAADATSVLAGWSGCDTAIGLSCTVVMNADRTVTASFDLRTTERMLSVQKMGSGSGTVTGTGISCGSDCTEMYTSATSVTLVATPDSGSTATWSGCDEVIGNECTVAMIDSRTVTVTFTAGEVITISADIDTPATWLTGKTYHVTAPIDVRAALTIQPGTTVRFDADGELLVAATINANGQSPAAPIIFTSASATPSGGDWRGITLKANGSSFSNCAVLYAGADDKSAIEIQNGFSASITGCVFAHHKPPTDSLRAPPAVDASVAAAATIIRDNVFYDNRVPLAVSTKFSVEANAFDNAAAAPTNPQPNKYNAVFIAGCGHVSSTITWPALPVPYVIGDPATACNYVVLDNVGTLTIGSAQANAVLKFFPSGNLAAAGTLVPHAIFTSIKDDTQLGDTNGDGAATQPAPGDWQGVNVTRTGLTFDGVSFLYAGDNDHSALSVGTDMAITVTRSTFAHNKPPTDSIRAAPALDLSDSAAATVVTGNTFFDNTVPLAVSTAYSIDDSNTFVGGAPQVGNKYQAIVMRGCGHITRAVTWAAVKVPIVIGDPATACNYVAVDAAGSLTIADLVVIKLFSGGNLSSAGTINAQAATRIAFTSFRDDTLGGDTNGDGAASAPAPGDWSGINLTASGSRFTKCAFLYAGGASSGDDDSALYVGSGKTVTVTESTFAHVKPNTDSVRAPAALDLSDAAAGTVLSALRFFDNTIPLAINTGLSLDDSNFFGSGVPAQPMPNRYEGVFVAGCGHVTRGIQWTIASVPMVIGDPATACNYMVIDGGASLSLGAGTTMKFFSEGSLFVQSGATLTVNPNAYLTSIKDDHLTDTNADGNATTPAAGDWNGVKYYHSGADPTCDQSAYMHYNTPNVANECAW